jgi:hypothetical protein
VTALGGRQAVADRLDKFTTKLNVGPAEPFLWAGNEPGFGVPWLYNYVGQPWKTQELVDRVRSTLFSPTPEGEPGNDDLGAMSAWYVWAALGLYPSVPGTSASPERIREEMAKLNEQVAGRTDMKQNTNARVCRIINAARRATASGAFTRRSNLLEFGGPALARAGTQRSN